MQQISISACSRTDGRRFAGCSLRAECASDPGANRCSGGGATIYASVEKLGLKLEQRKAKVEQVIVDSAEKTPTEN